jgi:hypothetical protein
MNVDSFLNAFDEFSQTNPVKVGIFLQFAATEMGGPDFSVWPQFATPGQGFSTTDLAQGFLCAHLLTINPYGTELRLDPKGTDGKTAYLKKFEDYQLIVCGGMVVAGGGVWPGGTSGAVGRLVLQPGAGTVAVVNGSMSVTFSVPQSMPAGTVMAFTGAQAGALYSLAEDMAAATVGVMYAPYTGISNARSAWNVGAG